MEIITLGAGCFWCVEATFGALKGVEKVTSGYAGGAIKNPSYKEVCRGTTGHAEVCQIEFNAKILPLQKLLEVFWFIHDPTTLNRQGGDVGTQYRSAIFYHHEEQKIVAQKSLMAMDNSDAYNDPIVTEITPFTNFYPAEDYHKDYFEINSEQPYCSAIIKPKMDKFRKTFIELIN